VLDGWQIEREQRSVGHGGCAVMRVGEALRIGTNHVRFFFKSDA
jgi:hypothetical protein